MSIFVPNHAGSLEVQSYILPPFLPLRERLIIAALTGVLANPYTLNDQKVVIDAIFKVVDGVLERLESESK
jgi:hypothetical protein